MPSTSLLLGAALFLAGLTLATDYRGAAGIFANPLLDPDQGDRAILRQYARRGIDHPELHQLTRPHGTRGPYGSGAGSSRSSGSPHSVCGRMIC